MTAAVYLMSLEPESGKSLVSLGLAEMLSQRVERFGYFRPVVAADRGPDETMELMLQRYRLPQVFEASYGVTTDSTRSIGSPRALTQLVGTIMTRFHALAETCDVVLVEGTDFSGASAAFEFELNAQVATNLAAPVVLAVRGHEHRPEQVAGAINAGLDSLAEHGTTVAAVIVNRVDPGEAPKIAELLTQLPVPVWLLPEESRMAHPNLRQAAAELGAQVLTGTPETLAQEVTAVKVAAMTPPNLLQHLHDGVLLITSGDRADVLFTAQLSRLGEAHPRVSGVLLTGALPPDPSVLRTLEAIPGPPMPILLTEADTFTTTSQLAQLRPHTAASDARRIALSLGLFESHVDLDGLATAIDVAESTVVTPLMFERRLLAKARSDRRSIVLPEGSDDRILLAAERILQRDLCDLVILDAEGSVAERSAQLGLDLSGAEVIVPAKSELRERFAAQLHRLRASKGMSLQGAMDAVLAVPTFGTLMVEQGLVDGMVSGAAHTTADTIRPALQIIRTVPGVSVVSSVFLMALADRVLVYGDCAVNPDPDASQLADIAISSARTAQAFGITPYVALLSYSTGESGAGGDVDKVREATALARERAPDLPIEGPLQYDAAVDASVAAMKLPGSQVAGQATVFIFPDLNTGNNTYKAVQRTAGAVAIGPVLQGLRKPVNDLSRGCTVTDIVNTVALTAVQAQQSAYE